MTKKKVLFASIAILIFVFIVTNSIMFGLCKEISEWASGDKYCVSSIMDFFPKVIIITGLYISSITLLFSLLTYKMREEVFQAWWRFARWFALVIVAATLFINYQSSGGGFGISGAVGGGFDAIVLALFYLTFVSVSAVIIFTNWALMRFNGQYPKRIKFIKLALLTIAILFSLPTAALAILMVATAYNQALF